MSNPTQSSTRSAPPGWYPDPEPPDAGWLGSNRNNPYLLRWWGGDNWGEKKYSQEPMLPMPPARFEIWFSVLMAFLLIFNLWATYWFSVIVWSILLSQTVIRLGANQYRRRYQIKITMVDAQRWDIKVLSFTWIIFLISGVVFLLFPVPRLSSLGGAVLLGLGAFGLITAIYGWRSLRDPQALHQKWDQSLNKRKDKNDQTLPAPVDDPIV